MPIAAEWHADGLVPIDAVADRLAVSNMAARERRTVAVADIREEPALQDPELGGIQTLLDLDTLAVLATPILVFDQMIGVLSFHRSEPGDWSEADILVVEAVARELGVAMHAARLLKENNERLEQQTALLKAAQVVTSELRLETVLQRLVVEVTKLLEADAADCYLYDADRSVLRCAAVYGLDPELVEFEFPAGRDVDGRFGEPLPHPAYEGFESAISAPMTWSGERRGLLGVASRDPDRRFSELESNLLETFAGLASLAVRNAASFEQSVRQARVQRGFYGIASALAEHLSHAATLDAVAHAANEALGGSFAAVLMPGARGLELAASYRLPTSWPRRSPTACRGRQRRSRRLPANAGFCPPPRSTTTSASARIGGASRAFARCWRSRSTRRAAKKEGSSSSSSPSNGRSRTTTWSSAAGWPEPPEAVSSGASSTRASGRRGRCPSSSRAWAASSRPSSTRARSSTKSRSRRRRCSGPTRARSRSSRETSSS